MKIAHLSDPHFGALNAGLDAILRNTLATIAPDLVVISGDITQRARPAQFGAAKTFIESLAPLPVICVPGNHDIPLFNLFDRLLFPYRGFRKYICEQTEQLVTRGNTGLLLMNSTQWWRHIDGELDLAHLDRQLQRFTDQHQLRVVVFHHPLDCPGTTDEKNIIRKAEAIAALCAKFRVDIVLHGHIHNPLVQVSTIRYPKLARAFVISVAGTCLSHRTRPHAPNSFHVLKLTTTLSETLLTTERFDRNQNGQFSIHSVDSFRRTTSWEHTPGVET